MLLHNAKIPGAFDKRPSTAVFKAACALEHCVHVRSVGRLQGMITYPASQRSRYRATLREMFDADAKDWGDKNC